ncbi:MAG: hypothetical protein COW04_06405 [Deltaproteobacteria bacterium CG12_big_fil_rev_8_21_14_0_65_43_10]|nr:MAG: hypothetical protein AUK23_12650 [Deltaproteobacteria bacterium CG2_30_43_15]PIQ45665.1 MAG: hypothetical protein COW04_06405 [Deltaproteobacteria bacterium CG12_big_fil_rev_8_21_14_0_65_43_10]PIU84384.1 MAG: hypothetical protein COS67_13580 [Deltaproteobacteria bacterium CG06_land_8_20_14_3_00_44_19]PIZ19144.1 MAG: hypothetical protein COY50_11615 [Deltaproteobacteria bacterium CG_4_10_14_0_8_um_filter_43_12]
MKLVLDTNIYSDYAEGLPETVDFLATHGEYLYLPSIVIGELNFGFMKGNRQQFNERKLLQFINRLKVQIIDVDGDVARKYAIILLSLQKRGLKYQSMMYGSRHPAWKWGERSLQETDISRL